MAYMAYCGFSNNDQTLWPWLFGVIAVLFNPIFPIDMTKEIWMAVDFVTGGLFAYLAYEHYIQKNALNYDADDLAFLGSCYILGIRGLPQDDEKAVQYYRKAAEQGHVGAQYFLGTHYSLKATHAKLNGDSQDYDYEIASIWYRKAAEQGHVDAQYSLGNLYELGNGVSQDYNEAAVWYRKAAEQGYVDAQYYLAALYKEGKGVPQDYEEAYFWSYQAEKYSLPDDNLIQTKAAQLRDIMANELTSEQRSRAQKRSREWMSEKNDGSKGPDRN